VGSTSDINMTIAIIMESPHCIPHCFFEVTELVILK